VTKLCGVCVFVLLVASASSGYAAETEKSNVFDTALPHVDLDDGYSVKLNTEMPKQADVDAPPALSNFRQDSFHPFLGLKLTKPLDSN
jgi:hypothetical protein